MKPPRYYDKWLEVNQPSVYEQVKENRLREGLLSLGKNTFDKLAAKEYILDQRLDGLCRNFETSMEESHEDLLCI